MKNYLLDTKGFSFLFLKLWTIAKLLLSAVFFRFKCTLFEQYHKSNNILRISQGLNHDLPGRFYGKTCSKFQTALLQMNILRHYFFVGWDLNVFFKCFLTIYMYTWAFGPNYCSWFLGKKKKKRQCPAWDQNAKICWNRFCQQKRDKETIRGRSVTLLGTYYTKLTQIQKSI